ncbi:phosphofructokinase domain-containing protein [Pavlovales sp. CCMP2436]|nr:phosphofructokinase domain-containing protein [Pavlovales sp. CCMP2436]
MSEREQFVLGVTAGLAVTLGAYYAYTGGARKRALERAACARPAVADADRQQPVKARRKSVAGALASEAGDAVASAWRTAKETVLESLKAKHPEGFGSELILLTTVAVEDVFLLPVPHLSDYHAGADLPNRMGIGLSGTKAEHMQAYNKLMGDQDVIIHDIVRKAGADPVTTAYLRAGPRTVIHFEPNKVRAAIVTCGGLCPGLNNIIQGLVRTLISLYGVEKVYGVRGGYGGFAEAPIELTLERVVGLQNKGGTMIGSGRGSFDLAKTIGFLKQHRISQLYVVGGDGTHRAANKIADEARRLKLNIAVPVVTEGLKGILPHLERVVEQKGYAVVVVAEGAGEELLGKKAEIDAGGNRKLPELGKWLCDEIGAYFKKRGKVATVKYVDPSYMIRSVPANASDAIYCYLLAQNAVHGAMAGYTSFSVGMANNRLVYIPIGALVKNSPRMMDPMGRTWERVLSVTGQPNTAVKIVGGSAAISTRTTI